MEGDTVNVIFKVVQQANKSRFETYRHQNVPIFDNVDDLRKFLLENFREELSSPADENSFRIGYITGRNQRFTIESLSRRRFCQHGRQPEVNRAVIDGE